MRTYNDSLLLAIDDYDQLRREVRGRMFEQEFQPVLYLLHYGE